MKLVRGDITEIKADAIVNAANNYLMRGGGVCGAIFAKAGEQLDVACEEIGYCETGEAKVTLGYELSAEYIIHAVGPIWQGGDMGEEELLKSCYDDSLYLAKVHGCKSVAFPLISAGIYGYPVKEAIRVAIETIMDNEGDLDVTLVLYDIPTMKLAEEVMTEIMLERKVNTNA